MMKIPSYLWKLISIFLVWRIITLFLTFVIISIFNLDSPIKTYGELNIFKLWGNWDGGHYIGIAEHGYAHLQQYAFFPLYPMLIITTNFIIPDIYIAALLISSTALFGTIMMLYKLAKLYGLDEKTALISVILLLIFPSAFFLGAAYTESLFLFLVISALFFAKKDLWFLASIFAGFATLTKFIAVILLVVLFLELLNQRNITLKNFRQKLSFTRIDEALVYLILFAPFGFYLYSLFLFWNTGYWFFFRDAQMHWGRSTTILNPLTVFIDRAREYIHFTPSGNLNISVFSLEVIAILVSLSLIPFIYQRFGLGLSIYSFIITIFTLLSGKTESSIRYILVSFPIYLLLAQWLEKNEVLKFSIIFLFSSLFSIMLVLFLTGNWAG